MKTHIKCLNLWYAYMNDIITKDQFFGELERIADELETKQQYFKFKKEKKQ